MKPIKLLSTYEEVYSTYPLLCFITLGNCFAQQPKRDSIVFVSVNDIHAALDQFPRFAYMVDSLRSIYPSLFLVGAGDYNSGNPINDYYNPKVIPQLP